MENNFLLSKNEKVKKKIVRWLSNKKIYCNEMKIENLIDIISACKVNLNEEISYCISLGEEEKPNNLYSSLIKAKNIKIDKLIDLYNESNTYNKISFRQNQIVFDRVTYLKKIQLEIDNFKYDYPISYKIEFYSYDGSKEEYNIIPYNYQGLYTEFFPKEKNKSLFKIANKHNIYIYNCIYNENGFSIGGQLKLTYNKEYGFSNGHLMLDRNLIPYNDIFVKYQPNENSFEFNIDKKIKKIQIVPIYDKLKIDQKIKKRLVLL